jgi:hypothetical protein
MKGNGMKTFMAVYTGSAEARARSGWDGLDAKARSERESAGMQAWQAWMQQHASVIVDRGGPLGKTKRANKDGVGDISNAMAGYVIVRAETHDAAARLFENHPHFAIFPGEGVEVMETLPVPGQ